MNYQKALRLGNVDLCDRTRGGNTDKTITAMRVYGLTAFMAHCAMWQDHVVTALARAKVKRRVAKRWSARLTREGLPREARLTGPRMP